ncbi:MAG: UDP-N-acetylglucosamine 2-epimerase [Anaerolineaceae bacterium]
MNSCSQLLEDQAAYQKMAKAQNPFGDGHAAERIIEALLAYKEPHAT